MPEQLTQYPDVTQKVLESAGAACGGDGADAEILTECPAGQLCQLPGGEVCVYGVDQLERMTQIEPRELAPTVCPEPTSNQGVIPGASAPVLALAAAMLFVGYVAGRGVRSRG